MKKDLKSLERESSISVNNLELIDLALRYKENLILTDFHIGYEESLNKQGILVPRFQLEETLKRLERIFSKARVNRIIINGDLKHEFGEISRQEWRDTLKLLDFLSENCNEIILIKGNHDTILDTIAEKRSIKIVDKFVIGDILIIHGDKLVDIDKSIKTIIIGHEHPAISLKESRVEKYKCFLLGKYKDRVLIVQPSFNPVLEGTDIRKEHLLSPYLQQDLSNFEVFIVGDKMYNFGKARDLP